MNPYEGPLDRRSGIDRRYKRIPSFKDLLIRRRRCELRRAEDRQKLFLFDKYNKSDVRVVITILVLSIIDAFLTLFLLSRGAVELNPVMAYFLEINAMTFVVVKYSLTALSVFTVILLHYSVIQYFRVPARYLLNGFACLFALVVVWELFLISTHILS